MTETEQFNYYTKRCLALMSQAEDISQRLIGEIDPKLEARYFKAVDNKQLSTIKVIHAQLCRLVDTLNEEYQ